MLSFKRPFISLSQTPYPNFSSTSVTPPHTSANFDITMIATSFPFLSSNNPSSSSAIYHSYRVTPNFNPASSVPEGLSLSSVATQQNNINYHSSVSSPVSIPLTTNYHHQPVFPSLSPSEQNTMHISSQTPQSRLPPPSQQYYQPPMSSNLYLASPLSLPLPTNQSNPLLTAPQANGTLDSWIPCNSPVTPHHPLTPLDAASRSISEMLPPATFLQPQNDHPYSNESGLSLPLPSSTHRYLPSSGQGFPDMVPLSNTDNQIESHRLLLSTPLDEALTPSPQSLKPEPDLCLFSDFPSSSLLQQTSSNHPFSDAMQSRSVLPYIPNMSQLDNRSPSLLPPGNEITTTAPSSITLPFSASILAGTGIPSGDLSKPINTLGPLCFAGFYLVTLTRTLVRNRTVPHDVRKTFMAPQLHFGFTVRDKRDGKWRHVHTVQIPYDSLIAAGEWLRTRLEIDAERVSFKEIKDVLQKAVASAWVDGTWGKLVDRLNTDFGPTVHAQVNAALDCDAIANRTSGTPRQFFNQLNCHKGASDIRKDVDGAISARETLKWTLSQLGYNPSGSNIPIGKFRDDIYPLWQHRCSYVREHGYLNCCTFYSGGYFKKIMIHKHLYNIEGCSSSFHVKDLFEGLDEVIKAWTNPTGMCVREAKCAAGLRYNVDKSFQSGIRSYAKAKFLEAAPHTAREFVTLEQELHRRVFRITRMKMSTFPNCIHALRDIETKSKSMGKHLPPDVLLSSGLNLVPLDTGVRGNQSTGYIKSVELNLDSPSSTRKRQRREQEHQREFEIETERERELMLGVMSTPREQKRKHAHLSLKRKEAAEFQVRNYLEVLRGDCQRQQELLDSAICHGEDCCCSEKTSNDIESRFLSSKHSPVL